MVYMKYVSNLIILLLFCAFCALPVFGYVNNIVLLAQTSDIIGFTVLRAMGVILVPLGAILGFF